MSIQSIFRATAAAASLALVLTAADTGGVAAQGREQTLADIRQEMSVLFVEIQRLRGQMNTTGAPDVQISGSVLERVDQIETQLERLTSRVEELNFRIDSVVSDGTNRLGDLEFRLCELEAACDIGSLGTTSTLGGANAPSSGALIPPAGSGGASAGAGMGQNMGQNMGQGMGQNMGQGAGQSAAAIPDGVELAVNEKADFDRAAQAQADGDYQTATQRLSAFLQAYPGSPLTGEVQFLLGEAHAAQGQWKPAARAYLDSFSGTPEGRNAPTALLRLGSALAQLGQTSEACLMLNEVGSRFPGNPAEAQARQQLATLGCQ